MQNQQHEDEKHRKDQYFVQIDQDTKQDAYDPNDLTEMPKVANQADNYIDILSKQHSQLSYYPQEVGGLGDQVYAGARQGLNELGQEDYQDFLRMRHKMSKQPFKRKSSQSMNMFNASKLNDFQKSIPDLKIMTRKSNMRDAFEEGSPSLNENSDKPQEGIHREKILQIQDSPEGSPAIIKGQERSNIQQQQKAIDPLSQPRYSMGKIVQDTSQHNFGINSDFAYDRDSIKSLSLKSQPAQDGQLPSENKTPGDRSVQSQPQITKKSEVAKSVFQEPSLNKSRAASPKLNQIAEKRLGLHQEDTEIKSATLRPTFDLSKDDEQARATEQSEMKGALYPPPEDFYRPKMRVKHECVNYGLNMYFKKAHEFSDDPDQAGGDLAPNQAFSSMPWGVMGCPVAKQENITDYVRKNIKDVVFSRYGMEYLRSFPRCDDLAIGSYRINLDYLIFQKQRHLDTDNNASLVGMSFLKTKGQVEMNRQFQQTQNASPDKKGASVAMGASMIIPFYKSLEPNDRQTLLFDSVFESGNLAVALKVSDTEYNCLLQNDINTNGHTQWFYFKVKSNFPKKTAVKINLINLYKAKSLYQYGMRVLCLDASKKEPGPGEDPGKPSLPRWQRSGSETSYIQNRFTNEQSPNGLFQIQFSYEFEAGPKEIYFAHSMPFTYSMLNEYLNKKAIKGKAKRQVLCHSLAGNKVEYLYITNKAKKPEALSETEGNVTARKAELQTGAPVIKEPALGRQKSLTKKSKVKPADVKPLQKQVIMITSRVHPGETNASWMMQGLLDTLLSPKDEEEEELVNNLKDHFEFYIIPMLNVDGVINGNYRCSLASCDLNRKWLKPSKVLHPPVYYTKKLCQSIIETDKKQFFLYLDMHGHSAKKNIFQYGNRTEQWAPSRQRSHQFHAPSVFPLMVSKQFDYFNFQDCTYSMPKSKDSTARITMFHKLRIPFVFTLEASFAGASKGHLAGKHFSQGDFENVGRNVLKAMWEVKKLELNKNLLKQITEEATKGARASADDGDESDGCSSSEEDELPNNSKKAIAIIQEQEASPSPRRQTEQAASGAKDPTNPSVVNPQINAQRNKQSVTGPQVSNKGAKQSQNRSIISLKTIAPGAEPMSGGKMNSPRKQMEGAMRHPGERFQRDSPSGSPVRRSVRPGPTQFQHLDGSGTAWGVDGNSDVTSLQNPSSYGGGIREQNQPLSEGFRSNSKPNDGDFMFDLTKNLIRAENPDNVAGERSGLSSAESSPQQQELFEQFNAQIEQSFTEQQQHLDEIFRQTAKQFLEQRGQPGQGLNLPQAGLHGQNLQHPNIRQNQANSRATNTNNRFTAPNEQQSNSPSKNGRQNWFLEQFLQQQKQNYQRDRGPNSGNPRNQSYYGTDQQSQPFHQFQASSAHQQQQQSHAQIQTFLQLQKLHQMQKLNQMAQMQFFRQQAELLLSQNLTQQQQWEVFQQFSYYQAQIQMQNQQYQMMLSQSLHGNNMQFLKAQYTSTAAAALSNQTVPGFSGGGFNIGSAPRQTEDNGSSSSQQAFQHHQFNRQRRLASTSGSIYAGQQINASIKAPIQSELVNTRVQESQIYANESKMMGARAQSPVKQPLMVQLEKPLEKEFDEMRIDQNQHNKPIYSSQEEVGTENTPSRQVEEYMDDYTSSQQMTSKKKPSRFARNSAIVLTTNSSGPPSRPKNSSQVLSEGQQIQEQPLQNEFQGENVESGNNINENTRGHKPSIDNSNFTPNQTHQQTVLKLKKGLVDFKKSQGPPQQAINFQANYKYPPEINAASQFEPQNFSQLLNQHLVDNQYQHLPSQGPSPNQLVNQPMINPNKKFFNTRGKFPKAIHNNKQQMNKFPDSFENESNDAQKKFIQQNQPGQQYFTANNSIGLAKPNSKNLQRGTNSGPNAQFNVPFYPSEPSSTSNPITSHAGSVNYQSHFRQNTKVVQGEDKPYHARFSSDVERIDSFVQNRKNEPASPDIKLGKGLLQTSNSKSNYSLKKHQQFTSTDARFRISEANQHLRGHERNLTETQQMQIVNSPPVRRETNQYFGGSLNSSTVGADLNPKKENNTFEVTIGKSKLIPVLHPQRQVYISQNESVLLNEKANQQPLRGAPGTAGGQGKSGASTGFAQSYGQRSDHLSLNKSQDENIMKKHYGLGQGSKIQTPQQNQNFKNFAHTTANREQVDFYDGDINRPKNSRHQQPVEFGSFSAPISQNTRKTPSQFQHYPPEPNLGSTIPDSDMNVQTPNQQKFSNKTIKSPAIASVGQNKKNAALVKAQEKQRISEKAIKTSKVKLSGKESADYSQNQQKKQNQ